MGDSSPNDRREVPVHMNGRGRVTIPQNIREDLDIEGGRARLNLEIEVIERNPGED